MNQEFVSVGGVDFHPDDLQCLEDDISRAMAARVVLDPEHGHGATVRATAVSDKPSDRSGRSVHGD